MNSKDVKPGQIWKFQMICRTWDGHTMTMPEYYYLILGPHEVKYAVSADAKNFAVEHYHKAMALHDGHMTVICLDRGGYTLCD